MDSPNVSGKEARCLRWIAIYNLSKGFLLCLLAVGLLGFLHKDIDGIVANAFASPGAQVPARKILFEIKAPGDASDG